MDALVAQLSTLPPTVNPYTTLAGVLRAQLTPPTPESLSIGLYVAHGLFGVAMILGLLVIGCRYLSHSLWWYRLRPTPAGTLFVPNAALWWIVAFTLYGGIVQALMVVLKDVYANGQASLALTKQLDAIGLVILSFGLWINAYEMTVATFARYSHRVVRLRAWHLHALFALVPAFELVVLVVLLVSAHRLEDTTEMLDTLSSQLAAQPWSTGEPFVLDPLAPWVPTLLRFTAQADSFTVLEKAGYGLITGDMLANCLVVVPATLMQVKTLRRHASASSKAVSAFLAQHQSAAPLLNSRRWAMRTNIYALVAEAVGVLAITLSVSGITAHVAVNLDEVVASGKLITIAYLIVFLSVPILVIPVHALFLWQALRSLRRVRSNSRISHSAGLTITTETKIEIDDSFGTRSFESSAGGQDDHVSIALSAMNRERTGLAQRTNWLVQDQLNGSRDRDPVEVFVLPPPLPPSKTDEDDVHSIALDAKSVSPRSVKFDAVPIV